MVPSLERLSVRSMLLSCASGDMSTVSLGGCRHVLLLHPYSMIACFHDAPHYTVHCTSTGMHCHCRNHHAPVANLHVLTSPLLSPSLPLPPPPNHRHFSSPPLPYACPFFTRRSSRWSCAQLCRQHRRQSPGDHLRLGCEGPSEQTSLRHSRRSRHGLVQEGKARA